MPDRTYIAIDLKSFYASVECADRRLDPLATNLVVADESRTEKTICLAVSPSLKACGIPGRARLFEVVQKVREANAMRLRNANAMRLRNANAMRLRNANAMRLRNAPYRRFTGKSFNAPELAANPLLELGYIVAPPRMARYMEVSQNIFSLYMRHVSPDDIHVYSIDEVFIDATQYLQMYGLTAHEFTMRLIRSVLKETGITATAGIGTNIYLAKVAMDIVAKHIQADRDGVRIAELDERSYRRQLWTHRPLTDFWRVGHGIAARLEEHGMRTMGDVARASLRNEDMLCRLFGINAELIIDHAWGWEPCTIAAIKSYQPDTRSISQGQVLQEPYDFNKGRLVAKEMADSLSLELVEKRIATDQMELTVCYDVENLKGGGRGYDGPVVSDRYGRLAPKDAHGTEKLGQYTSSSRLIVDAVMRIYDRTVNNGLLVRRLYVVANHILPEAEAAKASKPEQLDLFTDYAELERRKAAEQEQRDKERKAQEAVLAIREKLGKNAILKGMNLEDGATARERNQQIGGHKA